MRKDKEKAFFLRKRGKSYREITKRLSVPKSTLSEWFKNEDWSESVKRNLVQKAEKVSKIRIQKLNKIKGQKLAKLYKKARSEARKEFFKFKNNPLFIAGISIYWGEGDSKIKNPLRIANSDYRMIKVFIEFLTKICVIDRKNIKAWILIYPDIDKEKCLNFWSKQTNLKLENFNKTIIIQGRSKNKRLNFGVCYIVVNNRYLKEKITEWLNILTNYVIKKTAAVV